MGCACDMGVKSVRKALKKSKKHDDFEHICGGYI